MRMPEDVIEHLGKGKLHWKAGYSAHALAATWHKAGGTPPQVAKLLATNPHTAKATLVDAFFERSVDLGDGGRPSQTDILAVLRLPDHLAVAAVEGKVDESFGPLIGDWLTRPENGRQAREHRLKKLCDQLGVSEPSAALRYQLFHRSVSALIEAKRYCAKDALLIVHSFSKKRTGFEDFISFLNAIGMANDGAMGQLYGPQHCQGISFYAGWVEDDCPALSGAFQFQKQIEAFARQKRAFADELIDWFGLEK
ncbi:MAG TPA: hypothetical protein VHW02_14930 [Rhizomicrobium sp.]|jgi:hypothetical protein|nr:hypothetical protein [Rhizomicrobium sp.]